MTSKRVSAPFDLMKELDSDGDTPKKQSTLTTQQTVVGTQAPPKPAISKQKTLVQPPKSTQKQVTSTKSFTKQVSAPKAAPTKRKPPTKPFTNGLFKPLTDNQVDMLEREYYTNKNMVGRDKLYFMKRKYGSKAPTQKAINDWLKLTRHSNSDI